MLSDDAKFFLSMGAIIVAVLLAIGLIGYWVSAAECKGKWRGSQMESKYGFVQGCRIKTKDGHWIPSENYREL
jgi:hypothetical protein